MPGALLNSLPEHPFWDFSLNLYQQPGIAQHCLALQDEYATDVNILLFCCWLGRVGAEPLSTKQLKLLSEQVAEWQSNAVLPLRQLRKQLKSGVKAVPEDHREQIRQAIQRIEIEAEHVEQLILAETISIQINPALALPIRIEIATDNLRNYLTVLNIKINPDPHNHLQALVAATFPNAQNPAKSRD